MPGRYAKPRAGCRWRRRAADRCGQRETVQKKFDLATEFLKLSIPYNFFNWGRPIKPLRPEGLVAFCNEFST